MVGGGRGTSEKRKIRKRGKEKGKREGEKEGEEEGEKEEEKEKESISIPRDTTHYKRISIQELINEEPVVPMQGSGNHSTLPLTKDDASLSSKFLELQSQTVRQSGPLSLVPTTNPTTSMPPAITNSATQPSPSPPSSILRPLAPQPSFAGLNIIAAAVRRCCAKCGRSDSPSWCRLPEGSQLLCNACCACQRDKPEIKRQRNYKSWLEGLATTRPLIQTKSVERKHVEAMEHRCVRCGTPNSPTWRRRMNGDLLCYACALSEGSHIPYRPRITKAAQISYIPIEYNSFSRSTAQSGPDTSADSVNPQ